MDDMSDIHTHVSVGFGDRLPGWFGCASHEAGRTHQARYRGNDERNGALQRNTALKYCLFECLGLQSTSVVFSACRI